ncbi:metalloprotease TIKI2-like protein [Lates japonicus]|uniref:Metalloprotease TIKI n=1 Tax=Lates japonicus TaxID=270547 RepID=A0AAD3NCK2_LATJO|nr:metalloprotease TIKI2-like protein [Lates japonicus]
MDRCQAHRMQQLSYGYDLPPTLLISAFDQKVNQNLDVNSPVNSCHFLGNHSVLDILRQEGYEIIHMPSVHQEPVTENKPAEEPVAGSSEESADTSTVSPTSWLTSPLSQLEEFGRHKRPRKAHRGHGRPRLFSDLWVRIGDGTTPPPNVRIINGYVTVEPPLTHQEQRRLIEIYATERHPGPPSSTSRPSPSSAQPASVHSTLTLSCGQEVNNMCDSIQAKRQDSVISQTNAQTELRPYQSSGMRLINKE